MWAPRSQTSPSLTTAYASLICALPSRSDFTSLPRSSMPASILSSTWNLCRARRLVATSPLTGSLGPFDFFAIGCLLGRQEIDPTAGRVNAVDGDGGRIAD